MCDKNMSERDSRARHLRRLAIPGEPDVTEPSRPKPTRPTEAACKFAVEAARLMDADHCEDVVVLDLHGISPICDYFVIATGTSDRQMRAVADHTKDMAKADGGEKPYAVDGYREGMWIVLDYVDVIVHIFDGEHRGYYDLDSLWGDCPKVEWTK